MKKTWREIGLNEIKGIRIGQSENADAGTGCTVFLAENGMAAGLDVRGGGPASRESELLNPLAAAQLIHGIILAGGSAFGLGAADGVMQYLKERDIGFDVGLQMKVPLVCQSDLFDLSVGDPCVWPDKAMGYAACVNSENGGNYRDGNYGAGCGATVGKAAGMEYCMKSGIGSYAVQIGELQVAAVVAVNALGDIYDWKNGEKIAGLLTLDRKAFRDTREVIYADTEVVENKFTGNTTIGVVITNGKFDKSRLCKIAGMAHDGYAHAITPTHTMSDGDTIFAMASGTASCDFNLLGALAVKCVEQAVINGFKQAKSAYGLPAYQKK